MPSIDGELERGVRKFVSLYVYFCFFYGKYKANIDAVVPEEVVAALTVIAAACDVVADINPPGPF